MSFERREREQQRAPVYEKCENFLRKLRSLKEAPAEDLVGYVADIGEDLAKKVKIAQLRKLLDAFEKVRSEVRMKKERINIREKTQPLKIHLAYAAGRQQALKPLQGVLSEAIDKVNDEEDFKKLSQFIEGLIAYHKFYGGD